MKLIWSLPLILLSACSIFDKPKPVIEYRTVTVPVAVPCIDILPLAPDLSINRYSVDQPLDEKVFRLTVDNLLMRDYIARLEAKAIPCVKAIDK